MNMDLKNEKSLKSYLLGDLNPDEQQRLEQHLMTNTDALEQLALIEDELIDGYLEGGLSSRDKEKFENYFLAAPERRQKLSFAKSLKRYVTEYRPKKSHRASWPKIVEVLFPARNPVLKAALAASLMLMIAVGSWSAFQISRLQVALDDEAARSSRFEQEVANLKRVQKPQIQPTLLTTLLAPGRSRSADSNQEIIIPAGEGLVQLDLIMEDLEYPQYQVILQRDEGDEFRTQAESPIKAPFSRLSVSTELLKRGSYVLKLRGVTITGDTEDIGSYYFNVITQ